MPRGSLEVFLVSAKGLNDKDLVFKMDPYVILTCRTQEQKSSVSAGSEPAWNDNFLFNVSEGVEELKLKIMDSDTFSDDMVGEAVIPLNAAFRERSIPPTSYNVVKDGEFCGEIKVGLTFTPEEPERDSERDEGGWDQSSHSERVRNSRNHERDDSHGGGRRHSSRERRDSGSDEDRRRGGARGRRRQSSDED